MSALFALAMTATPGPSAAPDWARFQDRFIAADGRVIDSGNAGISHSEGQSYGMLLAEGQNDRPTFQRIWDWTRQHLRVRGDRLFAWKWSPKDGVADTNNATDADVVTAWALLRASRRWHEPTFRMEAVAIADDVLAKLYRSPGGFAYLLPGEQGFTHPDGDVVNPSYCVFPAFDALAEATVRPEWGLLATSSIAMLRYASFGPHQLPPDWLKLGRTPKPAPDRPARFGFDAVRVPLWGMWGRRVEVLAPFRAFWAGKRPIPAWVGLEDQTVAPFEASNGVKAIAAATQHAPLPPWDDHADYYSASLLLLTQQMQAEGGGP